LGHRKRGQLREREVLEETWRKIGVGFRTGQLLPSSPMLRKKLLRPNRHTQKNAGLIF